ncbi:MAG: hypothetical protein ACP5U1_04530 [Desulfomonilaceae bacterium]
MRKEVFVLVAFISVFFWLFTSVEAKEDDHKRERKSKSVAPPGSGHIKSGAQPSVHRQEPSRKAGQPGKGQYSKPEIPKKKQFVPPPTPQTNIKQGGTKIPIQRAQPQQGPGLQPKPSKGQAQQYLNVPRGDIDRQPGHIKRKDKDISIQGFQPGHGPVQKPKPTQGQVQQFLNLPKSDIGRKPGPSLGKMGAAALGGAAGAVALDYFLAGGRPSASKPSVGHMPVKAPDADKKFSHRSAEHIRNSYSDRYSHFFNQQWWARHPNLAKHYWHNHIWPQHPWNYWWSPANWITLSSWVVWHWRTPVYYNYGSNFYYDDGYVYLNGQKLCSAPEYYQQAVRIIDSAPEITNDKDQWMPLGVFSLTPDVSKASSMVLQLAVSKEGNIQGTYYNAENDTTKPVKGTVDKETQRAVWTFADKNQNVVIMETGIYNLTKDETSVLAHFGKDRTEEWFMVRLKEPVEAGQMDMPNAAQ